MRGGPDASSDLLDGFGLAGALSAAASNRLELALSAPLALGLVLVLGGVTSGDGLIPGCPPWPLRSAAPCGAIPMRACPPTEADALLLLLLLSEEGASLRAAALLREKAPRLPTPSMD